MKVTVCIGSSCHIRGSRSVVEQLQNLIRREQIGNIVELGGSLCMGRCMEGVCVLVDGEFHSVTPESTEEFFNQYILREVKE